VSEHEARDALIGAMRTQYEENHGRAPDAKAARKIDQLARETAERCDRNKTFKYRGRGR
jgi:hypothetical protein